MRSSISGITPSMVETYCSAIWSQNLNGRVLYNCNLEELKSVLNMNFGDWEIFRMFIETLRDMEKNAKRRQGTSRTPGVTKTTVHMEPVPSTSPVPSIQHPSGKGAIKHQTSLEKEVYYFSTNNKIFIRNSCPQINSKVTLEDAMISGLLSTLNEEAHEDILTEELITARREGNNSNNSTGEGASSSGEGR